MDDIDVSACTSLPAQDDLTPVLLQYYQTIVARMADSGFPLDPSAPKASLAEFWENASDYLPPNGCIVLARRPSGEIVGCGMMKRLDRDTGELKRVFVIDAVRGTGTGRALIEAREATARAMGLKRLVADTLTPNVEMRSLYPKLGFVEVDIPIETTTHKENPDLRPYLHYFSKDL